MNNYVTGSTIKALREAKKLTQSQLADIISVSDKAVSRWETGKGFPDISLLESLSKALGISVIELISGECITNKNISSNMQRSKFYVCPICGNVIHSMGETLVSCCGIKLPVLEAEETDDVHYMNIEYIEDESYIMIKHEMTKQHHISFIAYVTSDKIEIKKLYPEGNAESRFLIRGDGELYCYCNHHGLFKQKFRRKRG
ncbi:MAG: helix-turn-helix domain-containing protein [Ruminococcus flavefaciens]|nr:helix-turn-helix domain-containing protein [Ruminococcus flavefaciens]MCM1360977.1 helix-turn-helix domain-containing protein [Clostridiales bacterium]